MGIVEIYVGVVEPSIGGIESAPTYYKLDLFKDESINLNYKLKDSNDIAKVFSTYSQTFSIPATDGNTKALSHFFDPDVYDTKKSNYVNAKIYVNKQLFKIGKLNITDAKYDKEVAKSYNITFLTGGATLKELVGDTLVTDIYHKASVDGSYSLQTPLLIEWYKDVIWGFINTTSFTDFIVPFISNKRVWTYGTELSSDIKWKNASINLPKAVDARELRPAVKYVKVIKDIFRAFDIDVDCPLLDDGRLSNLFIHATGKNLYTAPYKLYGSQAFEPYTNLGGHPSVAKDWDISLTTSPTNYFTISINNEETLQAGNFRAVMSPTPKYDLAEEVNVTFRYIDRRPGREGNILYETPAIKETVVLTGAIRDVGYFPFNKNSYGGITIADPLKFTVEVVGDNPFDWVAQSYGITVANSPVTYKYQKNSPANSNITDDSRVNISRSLPEMKVIDFLSSFFKMFNMYVFQENDSETLKMYTANEFIGKDVTYNLIKRDYTVKTQEAYNKYNFHHKESNYFSNVAFKKAVGRQYGQLIYDTKIKENKGTYEVASEYTIVPQVLIAGTNIVTQYGFDSSTPTDDDLGNYGNNGLYTPNTEDMTLFYYNSTREFKDDNGNNISIGFDGDTVCKELTRYPMVSIFKDIDTVSTSAIGFQIEVGVYPAEFIPKRTLYYDYYDSLVKSLVNVNTKLYSFECMLSPLEVLEFSLTNKVIIRNRRYKIEEASITITTGKTKLTLTNI